MQLNVEGYANMKTATVTRNPNTIGAALSAGEFQIDFADGTTSLFTPLQFHFHAPSEHTVDGRFFDLELHIVHHYKDEPTQLGAVLGIFFDRKAGGNKANPLLESLQFDKTIDGEGISVSNLNLASFLDGVDLSAYWSYDGSLTTPPCSEGIEWNVVREVQPISDAQLRAFT